MNQENAVWYLAAKGNQHAGPYTSGQVLQGLQKGRVSPTTLCWRKGMAGWQRLAQVEPFASAAASCGAAAAGGTAQQGTPGEGAPQVPPGGLVARRTAQRQDAAHVPPAPPAIPAGGAVRANVQVGLTSPTPSEEKTIWEGRPSLAYHMFGFVWAGAWVILWIVLAGKAPQVLNLLKQAASKLLPQAESSLDSPYVKSSYLTWFFVLMCLWALWRLVRRVLVYLNWYYMFTTQRLRVRSGILSREFKQMELFRLKDIKVVQTVWGRLFNYTHIYLISTDRFLDATTKWCGLPGGLATAEKIRSAAQAARTQTGVQTIHE